MPQRHVIRQSNGNFMGFPRIVIKIVKNYIINRNLHFSDKWKNLAKNTNLLDIGEFNQSKAKKSIVIWYLNENTRILNI